MAFGGDDHQAARLAGLGGQADVGAAACHVRRHGDRTLVARPFDDRGLLGLAGGVEHAVIDARLGQEVRDRLGGRHAPRAQQHRSARAVVLGGTRGGRFQLLGLRREEAVGRHLSRDRLMRRHGDDREAIPPPQLVGHFAGGAGHARQSGVTLEERLVAAACGHVGGGGGLEPLLHLDGLVKAELPLAAGKDAAGRAVDDHHLAVGHDVVLAQSVQHAGRQRLHQQLLAAAGPGPEWGQVARTLGERVVPRGRQRDGAKPLIGDILASFDP